MNYPRVSKILQDAGVTSNWKMDEFYAIRGQNVHKATALFDQDNLDFNSVGEEEMPFFQGWVKFRAEVSFEIVEVELPFVSEEFGYMSHGIDRLVRFEDRKDLLAVDLIDLKCSKNFPSHIGQQTMAYKKGCTKYNIQRRYGLLLPGDGTYKLKELTNNNKDLTGWFKSLKTYYKEIKNVAADNNCNQF